MRALAALTAGILAGSDRRHSLHLEQRPNERFGNDTDPKIRDLPQES